MKQNQTAISFTRINPWTKIEFRGGESGKDCTIGRQPMREIRRPRAAQHSSGAGNQAGAYSTAILITEVKLNHNSGEVGGWALLGLLVSVGCSLEITKLAKKSESIFLANFDRNCVQKNVREFNRCTKSLTFEKAFRPERLRRLRWLHGKP